MSQNNKQFDEELQNTLLNVQNKLMLSDIPQDRKVDLVHLIIHLLTALQSRNLANDEWNQLLGQKDVAMVESLECENSSLVSQVTKLQQHTSELEEHLKARDTHNSELEKELNAGRQALDEVKKHLQSKDKEIAKLTQELAASKEEAAKLTATIIGLSSAAVAQKTKPLFTSPVSNNETPVKPKPLIKASDRQVAKTPAAAETERKVGLTPETLDLPAGSWAAAVSTSTSSTPKTLNVIVPEKPKAAEEPFRKVIHRSAVNKSRAFVFSNFDAEKTLSIITGMNSTPVFCTLTESGNKFSVMWRDKKDADRVKLFFTIPEEFSTVRFLHCMDKHNNVFPFVFEGRAAIIAEDGRMISLFTFFKKDPNNFTNVLCEQVPNWHEFMSGRDNVFKTSRMVLDQKQLQVLLASATIYE